MSSINFEAARAQMSMSLQLCAVGNNALAHRMLITSLRRCPVKDLELRHFTLAVLMECTDGRCLPVIQDADLVMLRGIGKDKDEPVLIRADAYMLLAQMHSVLGSYTDSARALRHVFSLCKFVVVSDVDNLVVFERSRLAHEEDESLTVREALTRNLVRMRECFRGLNISWSIINEVVDGLMPDCPLEDVRRLMHEPDFSLDRVSAILRCAGPGCDLHVPVGWDTDEFMPTMMRLRACGLCKMAFYCSRGCQARAWKAGHRDECRAHDELAAGDIVAFLADQTDDDGGEDYYRRWLIGEVLGGSVKSGVWTVGGFGGTKRKMLRSRLTVLITSKQRVNYIKKSKSLKRMTTASSQMSHR